MAKDQTMKFLAARSRVLLGLALALVACTLVGIAWSALRPRPELDLRRFRVLEANRRFDVAASLLDDHLRLAPDDSDALFLSARLILERTDGPSSGVPREQAARALANLDRVRGARVASPALVQLYRGKALYHLNRWDAAERAWVEALRLDPVVPEASWALLELYYLEGRPRDAAALALRQHLVEPDPHDRANLLLELVRQDAIPPSSASLVPLFEAVVSQEPAASHPRRALGLALIRSSQPGKGLQVLRFGVEHHPHEISLWESLLIGIDEAGLPDALDQIERTLQQLPPDIAKSPTFAEFRGRVAQGRRDWTGAVALYRQAASADPSSYRVAYRLARTLRLAGQLEEADRWEQTVADYKLAVDSIRPLYQEANAVDDLGTAPHPELYVRLAENRTRMLRPNEAAAWCTLAAK